MSSAYAKNQIIAGMATILWGDSWAQHIENAAEYGFSKPCQSLSGCKIEDVMPAIPKVAKQAAIRLAIDYRHSNEGLTVVDLFIKAYQANTDYLLTYDEIEGIDDADEVLSRFGECLAWMAMGSGVSWFDDNEDFPMKTTPCETYNLEDWAAQHCKDCE